MRKIFLSLFVLAFVFSFSITALAAEGHSNEKETDQNMDQNMDNMDPNMDHTETDHSDVENSLSSDENAGEHEEDADHHGVVVETPPNYKVLGTYGAVNLSFILIGVWNKWIRRKVK